MSDTLRRLTTSSRTQSPRSFPATKRMLKVASNFHRYSFNNHLMIFCQRPDATARGRLPHVEVTRSVREEGREDLRSVQVPHEGRGRQRRREDAPADPRLRVVYVFDTSPRRKATSSPPRRGAPEAARRRRPEGIWDALVAQATRGRLRSDP
jgi:hypothetical protein